MKGPDRLRIPIANTSYVPWEMQEKELRDMGIKPEFEVLWRWETDEERYLRKLEEDGLNG